MAIFRTNWQVATVSEVMALILFVLLEGPKFDPSHENNSFFEWILVSKYGFQVSTTEIYKPTCPILAHANHSVKSIFGNFRIAYITRNSIPHNVSLSKYWILLANFLF